MARPADDDSVMGGVDENATAQAEQPKDTDQASDVGSEDLEAESSGSEEEGEEEDDEGEGEGDDEMDTAEDGEKPSDSHHPGQAMGHQQQQQHVMVH